MAVQLGKRKRASHVRSETRTEEKESSEDEDVKARFARAFQAKFAPLEVKAKIHAAPIEEAEDESELDGQTDNDWTGLSDDGADDGADFEVVNVQQESTDMDDSTWLERKAFMSSKMPASAALTKAKKDGKAKEEGDDDETMNVKNDVALQRLLKESHLFQPGDFKNLELQGKSRLKSLDLRLQDLGAKNSHLAQAKMPLSHYRGIQNKAVSKEKSRRKEAKENGIILEREKFVAKSARSREKDIGGPSIGKFKGGMLQLSGRDLKSIEHGRSKNSKRKR